MSGLEEFKTRRERRRERRKVVRKVVGKKVVRENFAWLVSIL